jgi:hypothetical protein
MAVIISSHGLKIIQLNEVPVQNALSMESGELLMTEAGEYIVWG